MITQVTSNVKGRGTQSFHSKYVLLHGGNGSGKSSLVHALELGCFKCVHDAAGKDIKVKRHLNYLSPVRQGDVTSEISLDTGERLALGSKNSRVFFPAVNIAQQALSGGTNALCRFLLKHWDSDMELPLSMPEWGTYVESYGSPRHALLHVEDVTQKSLRGCREAKKELEIVRRYVEGFSDYDGMKKMQDDLEAQHKNTQAEIQRQMRRFVMSNSAAIEGAMRRYIPDSLPDAWLAFDGKDIRMGFVDRPVPSGAESVILAVALAAVTLPLEDSVYIFPDRAYDSKTLGAMMRTASIIPAAGVYIQSTVLPEDYDAEALGWQIVTLS